MTKDRPCDVDPVAGKHAHHRRRRVAPAGEEGRDIVAIAVRGPPQEMDRELLIAAHPVAVVDRLLAEQPGGGAEERGVPIFREGSGERHQIVRRHSMRHGCCRRKF